MQSLSITRSLQRLRNKSLAISSKNKATCIPLVISSKKGYFDFISHKLGENGFKANMSGSYYNALESVNDTFKFLEDAIASTGVNTAERKVLLIGVNADS